MLSILLGARAHLHDPGRDHPEAKERVERLAKSLTDAGYSLRQCPREATREELTMVHDPSYVDYVLSLGGREVDLDQETHLGRESVQAALNAAGTALELADEVLGQDGRQVFAVARPPGHHARSGAAGGYCVFNNVALAAERLRRQGLRVGVLDWDVHHGDGTEQIFFARPDVLFVSIHSDRLFPHDTGDANTVGFGDGRGTTVNIPLPGGATLAAYQLAVRAVVLPAMRRFRPDVVLASLGFDARRGDPQGNFLLETEDFAFIGAATSAAAVGSAQGRVGMVLEGGYTLEAIGPCAVAAMGGLGKSIDQGFPPGAPTAEERASV
ncbi:MAG TPA: histone deacetylase, partial [Polyangia bacterium]